MFEELRRSSRRSEDRPLPLVRYGSASGASSVRLLIAFVPLSCDDRRHQAQQPASRVSLQYQLS